MLFLMLKVWVGVSRLQQFQLSSARHSFGAALNLQLVKDSLVVPLIVLKARKSRLLISRFESPLSNQPQDL